MFWKRKGAESKASDRAMKAILKVEGPLWGYMVTQRGVVVDVLQQLRRVEREGSVVGKPATMVRIFDPVGVEKEGIVIESYESFDAHRKLILYEGYYREPGMADIHIGRAVHVEEKTPR